MLKRIKIFFKKKIKEILIKKNFVKIINFLIYYSFCIFEKISPNYIISYKLLNIKSIKGQKFLLSDESKATISPPNFDKKLIKEGNYEKIFAKLIDNVKFSTYYFG